MNLEPDEQIDPATYQAAIDFLYSRINYEKGHASYSADNYRLDRMRRLLDLIGNPQNRYQIVHVAGTKGKGTTSNAIAALLHACGFRVGVYTSPHLLRLEERIHCIGRDCTAVELVSLVDRMRHAAEVLEAEGSGRPTFFELTTAMGMLRFAEVGCDYVVLEVGLGGRLDSTNVCQPAVCAITSISLDHQAQLGDTIAAIAGEKAGIIKHAVPVVSSARHPDARAVISRTAHQQDAALHLIDRDFSVEWRPIPIDHDPARNHASARALIDYRTSVLNSWFSSSQWRLPLLGRHQADNLACALTVIDVLAKSWQQPRVPLSDLQAAILNLKVPARLQVVGNSPIQIIDTAHNPASISATMDALDIHFPNKPRTIVFASSRDKDFEEMLQILITRAQRLVLTVYQNNVRGVPLSDLQATAHAVAQRSAANSYPNATSIAAKCEAHSANVNSAEVNIAEILTAPDATAAWQLAKRSTTLNEIVCGTGSFFLASELLAIIK